MTEVFLIAHLVNAISLDVAEIEIEVAHHQDGIWCTNDGTRVLPFWTQEIDVTIGPIPDNWIEYVHQQADKTAAKQRSIQDATAPSLASRLGIGQRALKIERRF